ncbi:MAG: DUF1643 domain-containing protein [Thermodesulfobacteriota bacterium]
MIDFIPAAKLKTAFEVFGHFYSVDLKSGERIECRSVLEIVTKERCPAEQDSLLTQIPDAIFVMMNPGSSQPLEEVENIIPAELVGKLDISLVPTKPDITQYQVMRVMHYCGWNHVRVLNISDMRDPKSGKFIERYKYIEEQTGFTAHSLFADERDSELQRKLTKKVGSPIICAWGVSADLDPLIERCLKKINGISTISGLLKPNSEDKYFHPLPTLQKAKEKWVNRMVAALHAL